MDKERPYPASVERLLGVLDEVQFGIPDTNMNGDGGQESGEEKSRGDGGLEGYFSTLHVSKAIKDYARKCLDRIFDVKKGVPPLVTNFMEKQTESGVLQCRQHADDLGVMVSKKVSGLTKEKGRRYTPFVRAVKEQFKHFDRHLQSLDLPMQVVNVRNEYRREIKSTLAVGNVGHNTDGQTNSASVKENRSAEALQDAGPSTNEDDISWSSPEWRALLFEASFNGLLYAPLEQLKKKLRAPPRPVIGEHEEMDLVNYSVCEKFVDIIGDSLKAAVVVCKLNENLAAITEKFMTTFRMKQMNLEHEQFAMKERPHSAVMPALRECMRRLSEAVSTLTQETIEEQKNSDGSCITLDTRRLLLPNTSAFMDRRIENEEAWHWSNRDRDAFLENYMFPKDEAKLMKGSCEPTKSDLLSAAKIVNDTMRAGLKDTIGRPVILLSDAKSQIPCLKKVHADKQLEVALPGVLQYVKDIYTECVLRCLLVTVKSSLEEHGKTRENSDKKKIYLIGKADFQMSWIPRLRNVISAEFDSNLVDVRTSPQDLQLALLAHGVEYAEDTVLNLCKAVGNTFDIKNMVQASPLEPSGLARAIEDPKSIYPYVTTIDFGKPVDEILLVNRGDERNFLLLDGEKAILQNELDNISPHQKGFVQPKTYNDLFSSLGEKGKPLAVAVDRCNAAFHAGTAFRTTKGLLADLAKDLLQNRTLTHEPTRQEKEIALKVISARQSKSKETSIAIWEAINNKRDAGQVDRSKTFADKLLDAMYMEWLQIKLEMDKPTATLTDQQSPMARTVPEEVSTQPDTGSSTQSLVENVSSVEEAPDVAQFDGNTEKAHVVIDVLPHLRQMYEREFEVLEENVAHAISGKWGKASGGQRSHRVNDSVAWLIGCVDHSVQTRRDDDSGIRTVVAEYVHRRSVNQDMSKEEYIRRRAGVWQSSAPVEQVTAPVLDVAQVSTTQVSVATEEQTVHETPGHPNAETQAVAEENSEIVQPSITIPDVPALLEDQMKAELPIAIAEWQRLQRTKIKQVLALLPETSVLVDFEKEFQSLDETIRHANDCVVKTHDALQEHATHIVRMARTRKRADVVGDFEAFAADFVRLNQFLNTLTAHENVIKALCDASEACENLLEKIDDAREHSREAEVFFAETLPVITAGLSPIDLGLIDHDKANGNGGEGILRRLEVLKRDIPPMHELCKTGYEFENEERRKQYTEDVGTSVQTMSNLFKKITGGVYAPPPESKQLLVVSRMKEFKDEEGSGVDDSVNSIAGQQPGSSAAEAEESGVVPSGTLEKSDDVQAMLDKLTEPEKEIAQKVLVILSMPVKTGYTGTGMNVSRLRKYLRALFPNQFESLRIFRQDLSRSGKSINGDILFHLLEKIAEVLETAQLSRRERNAGAKDEELTNGNVWVDKSALIHSSDPLVLSLNNRRNFVFTLTPLGRSYVEHNNLQLNEDQIALCKKVKEEEGNRKNPVKH